MISYGRETYVRVVMAAESQPWCGFRVEKAT